MEGGNTFDFVGGPRLGRRRGYRLGGGVIGGMADGPDEVINGGMRCDGSAVLYRD